MEERSVCTAEENESGFDIPCAKGTLYRKIGEFDIDQCCTNVFPRKEESLILQKPTETFTPCGTKDP